MANGDAISHRQVIAWIGAILGFLATVALALGGTWAGSVNSALADQDQRIDQQEIQNKEILTKLGYIAKGIGEIKESARKTQDDVDTLRKGQNTLRNKVDNLGNHR